MAQTDAAGALTWTASYEAFGTRPVETGTNEDRQRANTKEEDPTGLLWEHFRYRDLETGVWLSRDPAGFVDGPNLYAYVRQNPWSKFDPLGLYERGGNGGIKVVRDTGKTVARRAAPAALANPAVAVTTGFVATGVAGSIAGTAAVSQLHHARELRQQAGQPQPAAYGNSTARVPQPAPQPAPQPVNDPPPAPPKPDGESANSISLEFGSEHVGITLTKGGYSQFSHLQIDPLSPSGNEQATVTTDRRGFAGSETLTLRNVSDSHINAALAKQSGQLANTLITGSAGPYNEGSSDCVTHTRGVANAGAPPENRISRPERSQSNSTRGYISDYKKNAREAGYE